MRWRRCLTVANWQPACAAATEWWVRLWCGTQASCHPSGVVPLNVAPMCGRWQCCAMAVWLLAARMALCGWWRWARALGQ